MRLIEFASHYATLMSFLIGLPTVGATYYQSWKAREEARDAREGLSLSQNCLEFVLEGGEIVNMIPLETLHSLPLPGDIVLLPGAGTAAPDTLMAGAYRITRVEHIFARVERRGAQALQARLAKAVAYVDYVSAPSVLLAAME